MGLSTKLRRYQVEGISWMLSRLYDGTRGNVDDAAKDVSIQGDIETSGSGSSSISSSCSKAHHTMGQSISYHNWQYYLSGWIRVPLPLLSSSSSSIEGFNTCDGNARLWYNLLTHVMKIVENPHHLLSSSSDAIHSLDACSSLILADDMGVGKTIQILGVIMMLKSLSSSSPSSSSDRRSRGLKEMAIVIMKYVKEIRSSSTATSVTSRQKHPMTASRKLQRGKRKAKHDNSGSDDGNCVGYGHDQGDDGNQLCICGSRLNIKCTRKQSLNLVQCDACDCYHHAYCAGFITIDEVVDTEHYLCLACKCLYHFKHPLPCQTTLIVMPNTLITQWINEIHKHTSGRSSSSSDGGGGRRKEGPLKVLIYPEDSSSASKMIFKSYDPHVLSTYDVIILSFKALQHGYHQSNVDYHSSRVCNSIYRVYPPAFLCLNYRLVILDETQHIESKVESQALRMACRISAISRICVSGTPLGSGKLSDLYSLCKFLRIEPFYSDKRAWKYLIETSPALPIIKVNAIDRLDCLIAIFATIMLRRTKTMIRDQLRLQGGSSIIMELRFSSFEVSHA